MLLAILAILSLIIGLASLAIFAAFIFENNWQVYSCISAFWISGIVFHLVTLTAFIQPFEMLLGVGGLASILFGTRAFAKRKKIQHPFDIDSCIFLCAAGLWLGLYGGLLAFVLSSAAGFLYIFIHYMNNELDMSFKQTVQHVKIPTAQSFAIGIVLSAVWTFGTTIGIGN